MATTTLALWNDRSDMTGVIIGGITVSWEEIDLATDRASAIDIGMTEDLCDLFEEAYAGAVDYAVLPSWLRDQAENRCEQCQCERKYPGQPACSSCLNDAYSTYCSR